MNTFPMSIWYLMLKEIQENTHPLIRGITLAAIDEKNAF